MTSSRNLSHVAVSGGFCELTSRDVRLLEEAAKLGPVHVLLWSDRSIGRLQGIVPKFPESERRYFLEAVRYVQRVLPCEPPDGESLPVCEGLCPGIWVVPRDDDSPGKEAYCRAQGIRYHRLGDDQLQGFPKLPEDPSPPAPGRKKVIVTGCYDWFHSGHVRFFEEVGALGDLYVVIGHDANIRLLKGEGHPMFCQDQRRYMAQSIRYVKRALISSGDGWLDAEPEILRLRPDIYAVNKDGDRPEKRDYCESHGIEYRVLTRLPKEGLPRRQSTSLRGF
jgi:cytidyltransferase-like protein